MFLSFQGGALAAIASALFFLAALPTSFWLAAMEQYVMSVAIRYDVSGSVCLRLCVARISSPFSPFAVPAPQNLQLVNLTTSLKLLPNRLDRVFRYTDDFA